jgi:hypothetical protein
VERRDFEDWIERYEAAWRAPGTQELAGLFVTDATYRTAPYEPPFEGLEEIEAMWQRERDGPDEAFTMHTSIVAVEGDTGVVRVSVDYGDPVAQSYRDLWVIVLREDGRARSFEEWPFWPEGSKGDWPRRD